MLARIATLLAPPLCWACGAPARAEEPLCGTCRRRLRRLSGEPFDLAGVSAWAAVAYEGPARDLVRALKFRGATAVAGAMAAQIAACAPEELLPRGEWPGRPPKRSRPRGDGAAPTVALVPVPLHPARLRRRGFNQALVIAVALGRRAGLPVVDCLSRPAAAAPQVGRNREDRLGAPAGAVLVRPGSTAPARAILVDDVVTTGATLAACAEALPACRGALAYAHTPGR